MGQLVNRMLAPLAIVALLLSSCAGTKPLAENQSAALTGILLPAQGILQVKAPAQGTVSGLYYAVGTLVSSHETIGIVTDSSRHQTSILALADGVLSQQLVKVGASVFPGENIAGILPTNSPISGIMFAPLNIGRSIKVGMPANVHPSVKSTAKYGSIVGSVASVSTSPLSRDGYENVVGDQTSLIDSLVKHGPYVEVIVALKRDKQTPSGYKWTLGSGPVASLMPGMLLRGTVLLGGAKHTAS